MIDEAHLLAAGLGVLAGVLAGLFGVGGGIVFVPALVLGLGLGQLEAEATSLAAMVPVVLVGAWRQSQSGLVDWRAGAIVGLCSIGGVLVGVEIALAIDEDLLGRLFGALLIVLGVRMALTTRKRGRAGPADGAGRPEAEA